MDLTHSNWMVQFMCKCYNWRDVKKFNNLFKYKCEALSCMCCDALLSSLLDPLEGLGVLNCEKLELGAAPDFQH